MVAGLAGELSRSDGEFVDNQVPPFASLVSHLVGSTDSYALAHW
jgi:hypothetical protein